MVAINRDHCTASALYMGETNDCVVRACAVALQIDYPAMHKYLEEAGRKPRQGLQPHVYLTALKALGATITQMDGPGYDYRQHYVEECWRWTAHGHVWVPGHYRNTRRKTRPGRDYNAATVVTLARELKTGTYLVSTRGHVLCLLDGAVHDWTDGRRHRIEKVHKVEF